MLNSKDIDDYSVKGMTMNREGHALKHFNEFDLGKTKSMLKDVRDILKDHVEQGNAVFYYPNGRNAKGTDEETDVKSDRRVVKIDQPSGITSKGLPNDALVNLLDFINDKHIVDGDLDKTEKKLYNVVLDFGKRYQKAIEKIIDNAVDCDKIDNEKQLQDVLDKERYITFQVKADNSFTNAIFLDVEKNFVVIHYVSRDQVATAFRLAKSVEEKLSPSKPRKQFLKLLKDRYKSQWTIKNEKLSKLLGFED